MNRQHLRCLQKQQDDFGLEAKEEDPLVAGFAGFVRALIAAGTPPLAPARPAPTPSKPPAVAKTDGIWNFTPPFISNREGLKSSVDISYSIISSRCPVATGFIECIGCVTIARLTVYVELATH